ncbi:MAG: T9SS type A sorting domain-containing protein [Sphingobacteriaceae bacterium]|nr:T9SS type A sorting domain-containing protein [Sphingobacteriaceae bacterium]
MKKALLLLVFTTFGYFVQAQTTNVTFQLDMNTFTGNFTTPEVNGTWNSWCGNCNPMADPNNDGVWTVTLPLPTGATVEFKYSYDNWAGQEMNSPSAPCTNGNTQFTNRVLVVPTADTTLGVVCWGSCLPCAASPTTANITFRVDMNEFTGTFTTPEINGTFNNWCGNCAPMTDANNDDIWEITINLPIGDTLEYKFSHDNWAGQETNNPAGACTNGNLQFTNRVLVVTGNALLPAVCWGSCLPCGLSSNVKETTTAAALRMFPNPAQGNVTFESEEAGALQLFDLTGRLVLQTTLEIGTQNISLEGLKAGLYVAQWQGQKSTQSLRLIVQ